VIRALLAFSTAAATAAALCVAACAENGGTGGAGGGGGAGGEGGCPTEPTPMFTLTITAADGPVPPDTRLKVTWSCCEEPELVLADPSTYKTLDDANIVCDLDATKPPPTDLPALVCRLWTSGPTKVEVRAMGYEEHDETYSPEQSERCEGPVPRAIAVELARNGDAGAP
jgi:hypothetical protein